LAQPVGIEKQRKLTLSTRFLIVGLPRSGTTYLMTLINSHPKVRCEGEIFNPYGIVGAGWVNRDASELLRRDTAPKVYLDEFFGWKSFDGALAIGAKWMIGHHPEIIEYVREHTDIRIINVHRENKLAQTASHLKAIQTNQWATRDETKIDRQLIDVGPRKLAQSAREKVTYDYLFSQWVQSIENPVMTIEYCDMLKPGFNNNLCCFLGVPMTNQMASPLVKQGYNDILSRFVKREAIAKYFTQTGYSRWLEPEL